MSQSRFANFEALRRYREQGRSFMVENPGLLQLLSDDIYPDEAHFIYEILQNSEDAGARHIRFVLEAEKLSIYHDGTRDFSLSDVEAITTIGESTGKDDETRIGKFGIGFKAVYSYTTSPEVHSSEFNFRILDVVYPEEIAPLNRELMAKFTTAFVLPFDRATAKSAQRSVDEIRKGLIGMPLVSLLFLDTLCEIEFVSHLGDNVVLTRRTLDANLVELSRAGYRDAQEFYFVLKEDSAERTFDSKARVGVATLCSPTDEGFCVSPDLDGVVSIYFPTISESSGLRFHVNGPFASTVSRDKPRRVPENDQLVEVVGSVFVQLLESLRARDMLDMSALEIVPTTNDPLDDFWDPVRVAALDALRTKSLVPTTSGWSPGDAVVAVSGDARTFIGETDVHVLGASPLDKARLEGVSKLALEHRNSRQGELHADVCAWNVDAQAFRAWFTNAIDGTLDVNEGPDWIELLEAWVADKSLEQLTAMYALVGRGLRTRRRDDWVADRSLEQLTAMYALDRKDLPARSKAEAVQARLIPVAGESGLKLMRPSECFLPSAQSTHAANLVDISKASDDKLADYERCIEWLGTARWRLAMDLTQRLSGHGSNLDKDEFSSWHTAEVTRYIEMWREDPKIADEFADVECLLVDCDEPGSEHLRRPRDLFVDDDVHRTGWMSVHDVMFPNENRAAAWSGYAHLEGGLEFLEAVGVRYQLSPRKGKAKKNPEFNRLKAPSGKETDYLLDVDWEMPGLQVALRDASREFRLFLWAFANNSSAESKLEATYRPNYTASTYTMTAAWIQVLRDEPWLEDTDGNYCRPRDLNTETLASEFEAPRRLLAAALKFGNEQVPQRTQAAGDNYAAGKLGFSDVEEAERAKRLLDVMQYMPEHIRRQLDYELLRSGQAPLFSPPLTDDEREKFLDYIEDQPDIVKVQKLRSTTEGWRAVQKRKRAYLEAEYGSEKLWCQWCRGSMPFLSPEGREYFEAVKAIDSTSDVPCNALLLCPTCAAHFKVWKLWAKPVWLAALRDASRGLYSERQKEIVAEVKRGALGVPLQGLSIVFSPKHLSELSVLLEK